MEIGAIYGGNRLIEFVMGRRCKKYGSDNDRELQKNSFFDH
jgi:hypothetical protein